MKKVKDLLNMVWELAKGKKTYVVGVCAFVYGVYMKDREVILIGLGLLGLRHGVSSELEKLLDLFVVEEKK